MTVFALKIVACVAMLIDHVGYCLNFMPFRIVGRIAFPIFLYLICNGYRHTANRARYALRLAIFALISQIPFSLFCYNTFWSANGNVIFTLLMALLCIWAADSMIQHRVLKWLSLLPAIAVFFLFHYGVLQSDYGARAILMAIVFFLFDGKKLINRVLIVAGFIMSLFCAPILSWVLHMLQGEFSYIPSISQWSWTQLWSALALPLIFAYNGKKGKLPIKAGNKLVQYGFYAFYPAHQLLLWVLRIIF